MRHSVRKEVFLGKLRSIMHIGTDAKSNSSLWGSPRAERNGLLLEDFIAEMRLTVLNEPAQEPNLQNFRGSFYIDVTMVSETTESKVCSWKIKRDLVTSCHVLIETVLGTDNNRVVERHRGWSLRRYCIDRVD